MDLSSMLFRSSPSDSHFVTIFHKIAPIIVLIVSLFAVCFIFTLISMLIIQVILELMLRAAEVVFGRAQESTLELSELESGIYAFRTRRAPFVFYESRPRMIEEREEEITEPAADDCSSLRDDDIEELLPLVAYKDGVTKYKTGDHCAICLDDYSVGESCRVLTACSHMFHSHCVDPWFKRNLTCPVCRQFIFKE